MHTIVALIRLPGVCASVVLAIDYPTAICTTLWVTSGKVVCCHVGTQARWLQALHYKMNLLQLVGPAVLPCQQQANRCALQNVVATRRQWDTITIITNV